MRIGCERVRVVRIDCERLRVRGRVVREGRAEREGGGERVRVRVTERARLRG